MSAARYACIGWGSLLWDPRSLPMATPFAEDGPKLPIEFSRVARDGRVTLVIDPAAGPMTTYWTQLGCSTLNEAIDALGRRERIKPERFADWIGAEGKDGDSRGSASPATREVMRAWIEAKDLDGVVWTALPGRSPDGALTHPSLDRLLTHVRGLTGEALSRAEEYIRRAPAAVATPRRFRFEAELGWSRIDQPPNAGTPGEGGSGDFAD